MKMLWTAAVVATASTLLIARAQDPDSGDQPESGRLQRVATSTDADRQKVREDLTQDDLEARERAFDEVVRRARRDPALRDALRGWAEDTSEGDLAWTARLALREVGSGRGGLLPAPGRFRFDFDPFDGGSDDPFQSMQEHIQRMLDGFQGQDPFQGFGFDWDDMDPLPGKPGLQRQSRSHSFELRQGPDGVEVEVTEDDGQGPVRRTYSAPTLEELYQAHPELRQQLDLRVDGGGADLFRRSPARRAQDLRDEQDERSEAPRGLHKPEADRVRRTDVLGVYLAPTEDGRLEIQSVAPGTIASVLRLHAGEELLEVNGQSVSSADDVRAALRARSADEAVRVTVKNIEGKEEERVWAPDEIH